NPEASARPALKGANGPLIVRSRSAGAVTHDRGPLRTGALRDMAFRDGDQLVRLAWVPLPAVPRSLSEEEADAAREEPAVVPVLWTPPPGAPAGTPAGDSVVALHDPTLAPGSWVPQQDGDRAKPGPSLPSLSTTLADRDLLALGPRLREEPPFGFRRRQSEPPRLPMSLRVDPRAAYSHRGDPLAVPPLEDDAAVSAEFIMPFANGRVTSLFNQGRVHPAIDLAGRLGSPVFSTTARQRVTFAGWRGGYGNCVMTRDDLGRAHLYGHLQKITARVGQMLDQGDKLGTLGSTGHSTGPHVHYEVRNPKGVHINPVTVLFPGRRIAKGYAWTDVHQQEAGSPRFAAQSR
ncbi:MAG TPA: M23 family metallopeptidase, partial [Hyphomicrobiaceae bacterium]|nr:M23 family metallopeptidase [Hyphomicrobiaceae bacterium]